MVHKLRLIFAFALLGMVLAGTLFGWCSHLTAVRVMGGVLGGTLALGLTRAQVI